MINYYVVLEIPNFSDQAVIKKAYRTLSKKYHPDVNKDPFAGSYFVKISEAYEFLTDENKRMLLHQYLLIQNSQSTKGNFKTASYAATSQNYQQKKESIVPVIHFFSADKKHFMVNDHILLQWNVSQCKSVAINVFGKVDFSGTHYLKIDHFAEEITVLMTVIGLNDQEYKYQIKLFYNNSNPSKKEFHKIRSQFPNADEIHFKKETFFGLHARINQNEFKNRIIFLGLLFLILLFTLFTTAAKIVVIFLLIFVSVLFLGQCYKRLHDTEQFKNHVGLLFIPLYNVYVIFKLFVLESEPVTNEFGMVPENSPLTFKKWIVNIFNKINQQLNIAQKLSMGSFLVLIFVVLFKTSSIYHEVPVKLTSYFIDTSRPNTGGNIQKDYFLVFNDEIPVNVSEHYFNEIVYRQKFDSFKIARSRSKKIEYIRLIDSKNNDTERLNFGVLHSNNPILLVALLLFLSQLYVWKNLTAPKEQSFANGYMISTMLVYIYALYLALF